MGRVTLVTGGSRSGKSAHAQALAEAIGAPLVYVATCPVIDEEMRERIARHQRERMGRAWRTIEEERDLGGALRVAGREGGVVLVDCLSLWVNNLMYEAEQGGRLMSDEEMMARCQDVLTTCAGLSAQTVFVTSEVGLGIVPADPQTRLYRDLLGRCNQVMAAGADEVILVACGLPLTLKKQI